MIGKALFVALLGLVLVQADPIWRREKRSPVDGVLSPSADEDSTAVVVESSAPAPHAQISTSSPDEQPASLPKEASLASPAEQPASLPEKASLASPAEQPASLPEEASLASPAEHTASLPKEASLASPAEHTASLPEEASSSSASSDENSSVSLNEDSSVAEDAYCSCCHEPNPVFETMGVSIKINDPSGDLEVKLDQLCVQDHADGDCDDSCYKRLNHADGDCDDSCNSCDHKKSDTIDSVEDAMNV